jgi:hypothetical protein
MLGGAWLTAACAAPGLSLCLCCTFVSCLQELCAASVNTRLCCTCACLSYKSCVLHLDVSAYKSPVHVVHVGVHSLHFCLFVSKQICLFRCMFETPKQSMQFSIHVRNTEKNIKYSKNDSKSKCSCRLYYPAKLSYINKHPLLHAETCKQQ